MTDTRPIRTAFVITQGIQQSLNEAGATMTVVTPDGNSTTIGGDPAKTFFIPILADEEEFRDAPTVEKIADVLIGRYNEFSHLRQNCNIAYLWKAKGGKSGGKAVLGKAAKASGLVAYYSNADFIIWIASDNCADMVLTNHQMEALIYHELCHCTLEEVTDKDGNITGEKFAIAAHDVTMFHGELSRYGTWEPSLQQLRHGYAQLALKDGE